MRTESIKTETNIQRNFFKVIKWINFQEDKTEKNIRKENTNYHYEKFKK